MPNEQRTEYAIELSGRGFVNVTRSIGGAPGIYLQDSPQPTNSVQDAWELLRRAAIRYRELGMEDMALQLRIVTRTKTVYTSYSPWQPRVHQTGEANHG